MEYIVATDDEITTAFDQIALRKEREEQERLTAARCRSYTYHGDGSVTVRYANGCSELIPKAEIDAHGLA